MKHRVRKQGEASRADTTQKCSCCHRTRRIRLKRIDQVIQRGLKNGEEAETHADGTETGCDP